MWIDYEKSKKAVVNDLYTCRDYILKGYFTIIHTPHIEIIPHFENRLSLSGAFLSIGAEKQCSDKNMRMLLAQEEQIIWLNHILQAIDKLSGIYREIIIYHYLQGYSLASIKNGINENGKEIKVSKPYEKNEQALLKIMVLLDECLVAYTGEINMNDIKIKYKVGAMNFVVKKNKKILEGKQT